MKKSFFILAIMLATGCTTPADNWRQHVTPMQDGLHSAEARGNTAQEAKQSALLIARAACDAEHEKLSVIDENHSYDGPDKTGKAAQALTQIGLALYNRNTGSRYGYRDTNQHYQTVLDFKCN